MAVWAEAPPAFFRHSSPALCAVASGGAARSGGAGPPPQPSEWPPSPFGCGPPPLGVGAAALALSAAVPSSAGPPRPCLFRLRSPRGVGGLGRLAAAQGAKRPTPGIFFPGRGACAVAVAALSRGPRPLIPPAPYPPQGAKGGARLTRAPHRCGGKSGDNSAGPIVCQGQGPGLLLCSTLDNRCPQRCKVYKPPQGQICQLALKKVLTTRAKSDIIILQG